MTGADFATRLRARAALMSVTIPDPHVARLHQYLELLARWNERMNLTALPVSPPSDEALDRLFVEPLVAAHHISPAAASGAWVDLGSGGGSPAIPLRIVRAELRLEMVESRERKAAFLSQCVRELALAGTAVHNCRFKDLPPSLNATASLITARAVRQDQGFADVVARLLAVDGRLATFQPSGCEPLDGFVTVELWQLNEPGTSTLCILKPGVPRGT